MSGNFFPDSLAPKLSIASKGSEKKPALMQNCRMRPSSVSNLSNRQWNQCRFLNIAKL